MTNPIKQGSMLVGENEYLFYPMVKGYTAKTLRDLADELDLLNKVLKEKVKILASKEGS